MTDRYFQEYSTPPLVDVGNRRNVTDLLADRAKLAPDHVAFRLQAPNSATLHHVTTQEFVDQVRAVAKGLIAHGVNPGDTITIQGSTGFPWALADMAALWVGAVVVPIFDSASSFQVRHIAEDAGVRWAFAETAEQRHILGNTGIPITVWSLTRSSLEDLAARGTSVDDEDLESRRRIASLDDTATLVYTSGTEAAPKGVIITHRNLVSQVLNIGADYSEFVHSHGTTLIFLPLAHVLARGLQLICLSEGMAISYEADPKKAVAALADIKPTFLVVVPRILEKIRDRIAATAESKRLGKVWTDAEATAVAWGTCLQQRQHDPLARISPALRLKHTLYDLMFYKKVRSLLGGNIEYLLSGAAPLNPRINLLFRGMGVKVIEGYGLTETTAPLTGNRPGNNYAGTVGPPEPGHTIRISPSGEVLARGVGVSPGYKNPEHNEGAFVDGFLRTGDLGRLDEHGRLTITGRVKESVVTAGGKTISPARWQNSVEENPLVAHAVVVGDSRPYPAALILVDPEHFENQGLVGEELDEHTELSLLERILPTIRAANLTVSGPERIKRIRLLLTDLKPGSDFVTPTMKLRRNHLLDSLSSTIDDLYQNGRVV